jgi:DNA-binding response OmpR family regulator
MVIDDEIDILQEIKSSLQNDDFKMITVSDSRKALELMTDDKEEDFGLILIDTFLPGTNKSALFSMKPKSKMHIDVSKKEDFLQKPFTKQELLDFVRSKV